MKAMKAFFSGRFAALRDQLRSWGTVLPRASGDRGPTIHVYAPGKDREMRRIGTLWQEGRDFVFRYDPTFVASPDAEPISAFPELDETYRSAELWPFFAVRIPPLRREDVRMLLQKRGLRPEQTLEVLGAIARKSATNPYELRLETDAAGRARRDPPPKTVPPAPMHSAT
jgi:HipA-like protein